MKETEEKKKQKKKEEAEKKENKKQESEKKDKEAEKKETKKQEDKKIKKETKKKENKSKEIKEEKQKTTSKNKPKKETKTKSDKKEKIEKIEEEQESVEIFSINLSVLVGLFIILVIIIGVISYLYLKPTKAPSNNANTNQIAENQTETKTPKPAVEFDVETQVGQIKGYLRYKSIAMSSPQSLLETFGLVTDQKFAGYPKNNDATFIQTDISYEAIRNEFQFYITKDFFASEYKNIYKPSNGITHVTNIEKPREDYEIKSYKKLDTKGRPAIQIWYITKVDNVESEQKTMKVEFSTYNGRWLISSIK